MASSLKNLSSYEKNQLPPKDQIAKFRFGIVVAKWNNFVTDKLLEGAYNALIDNGAQANNIEIIRVPGSFELTYGAKYLIENSSVDAVIALGCIIRGETPHFDYISQGVTFGLTQLNIQYNVPVIFGVLTTDNKQQALDRAGGKMGNKGTEAAVTAIEMIALSKNF